MEITADWIFGIINVGAIGFIGWNLKQLHNQNRAEKDEIRQLIAQLEKKLFRLEEKLPEKYVLKEDFCREINKLDMKLDSIKDNILELSKNIAGILSLIKGECKD